MGKFACIIVACLIVVSIPTSASASPASAIIVHPGQSIQAAVDQAAAGDTIMVDPGVYTESGRPCPTNPAVTCAVVIAKDGIKLIGRSSTDHPVVIENAGGQDQGIAIAKTGDSSCLSDPTERVAGALVSGFTVNDFEGEGVFLFCVDGW